MANRRFGGGGMGGGLQRGGRSFPQHQQQYQGNGVSPWQAPNSSLNPGLLTQLSAPHQLALALTSLLQPQQQQQPAPPSLLSLNTTPFAGQDHYDSQNRFGNRGRSDFKRLDPYNKGGRNNNWRNETNRPRGNFNNRNQQQRNNNRDRNNRKSPNKDRQRPEKKIESEDKPKIEVKAEKDKNESIDLSVDDIKDEELNGERKRDWKEEKNVSDDKDKDDGDEKEDTGKESKPAGKDDEKKREGRYHGVPAGLLHCFVCNKSMWDGESFQNHIRGKAHKQMLQSLEESFQITVNILRENMRLVEEQKMIELSRMNRNSRGYHRKPQEQQSTCNMCDLKFLGKIIVHRKTEGHQRLKRFLHPNCDVCNQEFPARMEWVEHRFSPEHLRKLKEVNDSKVGDEHGAIVQESLELDLEPLLEESLQTEHEKPVLELSDDMSNFQNRIPAYKKNRPVSTESLRPADGFVCGLCDRFFASEDLANEHLMTQKHYYAFIEAAKKKCKRTAGEKAEGEGNAKRRKLEGEGEGDGKGEGGEKMETSVNGDGGG